jgi:hypothetical protein
MHLEAQARDHPLLAEHHRLVRVSIAPVTSRSVRTGLDGSFTSSTFTPPSWSRALVGYISVVS